MTMPRLVLALLLALAVSTARAATFTVDSTGDGVDANAADGLCADAGGQCTLRAAIQQANAAAGGDVIAFAIPGPPAIAPTKSLPPVTDVVTIDGTTQPGGRVTLDGTGAGDNAGGLVVLKPGCVVRGLAIGNFAKNGILIFGGSNATIDDTFVGLGTDGVSPAPNALNGIVVGGSNVTITASAVGYNGLDGVAVAPGGAGNRITQTRFLSNGALGIDLGDDGLINPNDALDADAGANGLQNAPYLIQALGGEDADITGGLVSAPNTAYTLEFFRSPACSPSEYGEGTVYLGTSTATTDSNGLTTFSALFTTGITTSDWITATATAPDGSTSEFSDCVKVGRPPKTTTTTSTTTTTTSTTSTSSTTTSTTSTTSSSSSSSSTSTSTTTSTTATTLAGSTSTSSTTTSSTTTTTEPAVPTGPLSACVRDPGGLAVDDVGNVYVSDQAQGGVTVFDGLTGQSSPIVGGLTAPGDIEIRGCDVLVAERFDVVEQRLGLSGRVLDFDFLPAPNARVTVRSLNGQSSKTFATDGAGRFAIALDFVPCELQGVLFVTIQTAPTTDRPSRTVEVQVLVRPGTPRRPFGQTVAEIVMPAP